MNRRDVERMLEELGASGVPGPSHTFRERVAERLRAVGGVATAGRAWSRPPWGHVLVLAGATAAMVVAIVLASGGPRSSTDQLVLASATDAVAVLPDGRTLPAKDGLILPEGSIVRTGPAGRVRAGDGVLGPNAEAVVRDGRLVRRPVRSAPPARPVRGVPQVDASPLPTLTLRTPEPTPFQPSPSPRPGAEQLRLGCAWGSEGDRKGVVCRWSPSQRADFAAYRLFRTDGDGRPTVIARHTARGSTTYVDTGAEPTRSYSYELRVYNQRDEPIGVGGPVPVEARDATREGTPAPTRPAR